MFNIKLTFQKQKNYFRNWTIRIFASNCIKKMLICKGNLFFSFTTQKLFDI